MTRQIIKIDEEKCTGCGACAEACHEGAIEIVNGKAKLIRDDYCDGLGNCLPTCPTGAITFEEREAAAYDEAAVEARKAASHRVKEHHAHDGHHAHHHEGGCPGARMKMMKRMEEENLPNALAANVPVQSQLRQWPVQIKLVPPNAPYFDGANLLIAADCTAYAYGNFHNEFMKNRVVLVGCPKLDNVDYTEKLTEIIANNNIKSVTVTRMEVPCCGGLEHAAVEALKASGKFIPWRVVTISIEGQILSD